MFPVVKPHYWALELVDFRSHKRESLGFGFLLVTTKLLLRNLN